ncbi:MAG: AAA family ATPase [Thermococci archaeon]|nr:AAA family ATPase [Thermococci archaeon]
MGACQECVVPSGIESLDKALNGGFPRGATILIAGNPGTGKTHLCVHILYNNMRRGLRGAYVSFAENKGTFYENAKRSGMDLREMEEKGLFKFYDMLTLSGENLEEFVKFLIEDLVSYGPDIVVFDSITVIGQMVGSTRLRSFVHSIVSRLVSALNMTAFLISEIPYGEKKVGFGMEEFVADGVIIMEMEMLKEATRRYMKIMKMRGRKIKRATYEYTITDEGIEVFLLPELRFDGQFPGDKEVQYIPTGNEKLDEMLGGGLLRGSVTLIDGPPGSGKTVLSLSIASKNALEGRKVLYITFEESSSQIEMTKRRLSLKGDFKVIALVPEAGTPIEYYDMIRKLVKEENAELLIIDSLSAMETNMHPEEFERAVRYIELFTKSEGITTVMTYNLPLKKNNSGFSVMADNVVLLSYIIPTKPGDMLKRTILILKSRRTMNDDRLHEFVITSRGIRIE